MKRMFRNMISLTLMVLISGFSYSGIASANTKSDQRKVRKEIKQLDRQIGKKQKESDSIRSQLTKLEKELGELSRKQHDTERKIKTAQTRLTGAEKQQDELQDELKEQHAALAQQLQAMHTAGEQSHLRLLLLQDNPSDISRNIQYFDYLNRYRSKKITDINKINNKLEAVTETAKKDRVELKVLNEELSRQKEDIKIKLASREVALKTVKSELSGKQKRMRKLVNQEQALQKEIDRIARRAAKKRAEAAAKKEAKRKAREKKREQQRIAKEKQRQKQQRNSANQREQKRQAARTASVRKQQPQATGRKVTASRTPNRPFSKLRGKLSWPVSGRVLYKYNSRRNEKQRWRGVVIAAPGGAKVKSVAPGRVVFSGWMNGYGHLIIIEHDRNSMSLYGYNRAVFKRVGQKVKANETIAAVGNSSGQSRNALYFEIRRKTVPQNPTRWLR